MHTGHEYKNIKLTASEIAELWTTYINDSLTSKVLDYYRHKVKDGNIAEIIELAFNISNSHLRIISSIYQSTGQPIPYAFSEKDIDINAPVLFSGGFMLMYIKHMARFGLINYSNALTVSAREDVRLFFTDCIKTATDLSNKADDMLLSKGLYIRPPYIEAPVEAEFVERQGYIKGLIGDKRPLNAIEISNIFINLQNNHIGEAFTMGLGQTIKNERVKNYVLRAKEMAAKHVTVFSDMLKESDLPVPMSYVADVSGSTEHIFSDRLIMYHITALNALSLVLYAQAMAKSMRADITVAFGRLAAEIGQLAKDGIDIMIDNEWLEKVPEAISRKELVRT